MSILVIAEHNNSELAPVTASVVAAASKIGGDISVLVAGKGSASVAELAAKLSGVSKVLHCSADHYEHALAENIAALVVSAAAGYSHIMAPATTSGKNFMPRVAALKDVAQISEIIAVESADTFLRPIYAGNAIATVKSDDVEGRTKIYESMVKGENTLEAGTPASFDVLTNEIRGLALNMQLEKRRI